LSVRRNAQTDQAASERIRMFMNRVMVVSSLMQIARECCSMSARPFADEAQTDQAASERIRMLMN